MENFQKEKQIMVDPLSLKSSPIKQKLPTIITTTPTLLHPPTLQPPKLRFLSSSLPNSVNSSPRFGSIKKPKHGSPEPQCQEATNVMMTSTLQELLQEAHFGKSKSCGDARESDSLEGFDFDEWLTKLSAKELEKWEWHYGTFTKNENVKESPKSVVKEMKTITPSHDGFKCNALCLFLPSFVGKIKPIKTRKEVSEKVVPTMLSRNVSLENFECGSWASAAMSHEIDGDSNNSYFDLPMELMKFGGANEVDYHSPIAAASSVYEKDLKGVLKSSSVRGSARKPDMSPRHVRFSLSSSSPSYPASPAFCISPRLKKAREDFNAFLAAQTA
ncbi:unnamed protein product [Lathyrus oleraceus]|uniref:uncharacterized protein LOC127108410 n=1 Tax=Pisum sativum TaxID=3888 RepID=UPI001FC47A28|nr:uncharacterized protein LOC127108410 [Pisum sativum]